MRTLAALAVGLVIGLTFSGFAQQPGGQRGGAQPQPSIKETAVVTASDIAGRSAGNLIRLTPYNVNLEVRTMGQAASVHETEAELFYVIDGAGTLVTGGKLTEERRTNPENLSGAGITGGVTRKVSKGDLILVPPGQPHQYPSVEAGGLRLMALHLPVKAQ